MTDIDTRLRNDAHAWQHGLDSTAPSGVRVPAPRTDGTTRTHWLAAASAAAIVAVLVVGVTYLKHASTGRHRPIGPITGSLTNTSTQDASILAGFAVSYPVAWRHVESDAGTMSRGPSRTVGYLTDQAVVTPECTTHADGRYECHPAVRHLNPGGIVVTFSMTYLLPALKATRTIAGLPATVTRGTPTQCAAYPTATYEVDAEIQVKAPIQTDPSTSRLQITACAAAPVSAQTRREIDTMLNSITR